jgi:hypothetical protein
MIPRPPCWPEGEPLPNKCASRYYNQHVYGEFDLQGSFAGWRIRGDTLIAPGGLRLNKSQLVRLISEHGTKRGVTRELPPPPIRLVPTPAPVAQADAACSRCDQLRHLVPALERTLAIAKSPNGHPPASVDSAA